MSIVNPKKWGPNAWSMLFTIAIATKKTNSRKEKQCFINLLYSLRFVLPCKYCRKSYKVFYEQDTPNMNTNMVRWLYDLKNKVSLKLAKQCKKQKPKNERYIPSYHSVVLKWKKQSQRKGCDSAKKFALCVAKGRLRRDKDCWVKHYFMFYQCLGILLCPEMVLLQRKDMENKKQFISILRRNLNKLN